MYLEIPIYIDGAAAGAARIEGGLVSARLRDPGRVVRLTVYGERDFYLGVPEPKDGLLALDKRLTAEEARQFPQAPRYAAEKRLEEPAKPPAHVLWHGGKPHYF